ncbi:MAG: hypothetical protein K2N48_07460 [Muribaculaceae bacterium]|nr:hypothetical protein [Muribaculaceae bacterium]
MNEESRLPLALFRQAILKLEAFAGDIHEIMEDESVSEEEKVTLGVIRELTATIGAHLINIVSSEIPEAEFLNEQFPMDEIGPWPGEEADEDLLQTEV